jgi:hypothetical protein
VRYKNLKCKFTSLKLFNSLDSRSNEKKITLNVDGTRYVVNPTIFTQHPDTMLGRMFSSDFDFHPNSRFGTFILTLSIDRK